MSPSPRRPLRALPRISARPQDLLSSLNEKQREAVFATDGPVLILAGAGSGKTKTLTHRIAFIMQTRNVMPENILALTFTNKAAREMRERVRLLGKKTEGAPLMGTFHSFCARILRRRGGVQGLSPSFSIYNEDEARSIMKSVIVDHHLSPKDIAPPLVLATIGKWKDALLTVTEAQEMAEGPWEQRAARLWDTYETRLTELNALDFDSLLYRTVQLLKNNEEIRATLEEQFRYISIDEYQDTNHSQCTLLKLLAGKTQNVCAVGDDAQAIYGWRGARVENIRQFPDHFPGCRMITLDQNYRSTQAILDAANAILAQSADATQKSLWTTKTGGNLPHLLRATDERDEGRIIVRELSHLFQAGQYRPADAAILYRTNAQSRALEEAFLELGIPYDIVGGLTFYERKEVRDIVAYLRFIANAQDELAFRRLANVPMRGIGDRTVEQCLKEARTKGVDPLHESIRVKIPEIRRSGLEALAMIVSDLRHEAECVRPETLLLHLLQRTAFRSWLREESERTTGRTDAGESRYENVLELATVAKRHDHLTTFLEELALLSDAEKSSSKSEKEQRVKLMTIHAAKGLEFPIVVVAGMEEGLLPHMNSLESTRALEEERRLCYVALTRAKERLFLSYARSRMLYGSLIETTRSRFLDDLPAVSGNAEQSFAEGILGTFMETEPSIDADSLETPTFLAGERVRHDTFGEGIVEHIEGQTMTVRFGHIQKRLDATIAPLVKIDE